MRLVPWNLGDLRSSVRLRATLRSLVLPLIVALPPLAWVTEAVRRVALETLGRDQGIFQYVAWALLHGARDYRDLRDVNGPLTHWVHVLFLGLGGADEHRFRVLDLVVTGASFAFVGACLPGVFTRKSPGIAARIGWAFAAWVVLTAQYVSYLYWDLAQRESFFDWFMLSSVALQLAAQSRTEADGRSPRVTRGMLGLAGALSVIPWFGKPTYVLFSLAQVLALLFDREASVSRKARASLFAIGGAVGAVTQVAFLLRYADLGAFFRIYLVDVPAMYRFIWPRIAIETLSLPGHATTCALSLVTSAFMLGLVSEGQLPRRALAIALLPVAAIGSVLLQGKGFPYHFHPVSASLFLQWLVIVLWLSERFETPAPVRLVSYVAATALALRVTLGVQLSPHLDNLWILAKGVTAEQRQSRDYLVYFRDRDYFPWEMRQAAAYLKEHTRPTDRVQIYGMDPYVLFLAERLSATPYIYAYDLDADAALFGSVLPEGLHPTWAQSERIRAMRDAHEVDFLTRLQAAPPAAFVFMDKAPLMADENDAWNDFATHCVSSAAWVAEHYEETAAFGEHHVWLRRAADGTSEALPRRGPHQTEQGAR